MDDHRATARVPLTLSQFVGLIDDYFATTVVDPDEPLANLGFDSIQMYELATAIEELVEHPVDDDFLQSLTTIRYVYEFYAAQVV